MSNNKNYPFNTRLRYAVDNFMSKSNSLNSCNVTIRLSCFSKSYATTYNQAKAAVEALDLYSVDYTEDSVDYTAKFSFSSLSDEYHNVAEVYYKDIIFNCLIIRT